MREQQTYDKTVAVGTGILTVLFDFIFRVSLGISVVGGTILLIMYMFM